MKDIILFGVQGSGKGTQAKILVSKYGYKIFETGAELRLMAKSDAELGKKVKSIIESGKLVDTNIIIEIVESFCFNLKNEDKVIFDGFPRNMEQMILFEKIMKKIGKNPYAVHIHLTKAEALDRLLKRFTCEGVDMSKNPLMTEAECIALGGKVVRRNDDNENSIKVRIEAFENETIPVISEYKKLDRCIEVNGNRTLEEVTEEIEEKMFF